PSESNSQERICRASGSQPTRWWTVSTGLPCTLTVKVRIRKLPSSDHRQATRIWESGPSATIAPDQEGRVPAQFGRPLGRRDHGAALGLDHVGTEELDRVGIDLQLHSRAGGEGLGQTLLDQGMTAVPCAVFLDDLRVLGEPSDQGLGVCLVVVANESVIGQADRLLLRRRLRLAGSLPRRGICWFSILSRGEANAAEDQACP